MSSFVLLVFFFLSVILNYEYSNLTQYLKNYCTKNIEDKHNDYIQSHMYTFYGKTQVVCVKYNQNVIEMKFCEENLPVLI